MYAKLNVFLLQRQIVYVIAHNSFVIQLRILNQMITMKKRRKDISSKVWKNEFASRFRRVKKSRDEANSCRKKNTQIMYNLIDILRDHWDMSTLSLRFDEDIFMRSKRDNHSSFDDDENNDDDDDENDVENDKKIRMRVRKTSTQISKKIKMMSTSNHLKSFLKRKSSRRMIKKTMSSNWKRMKKTMKWHRRKTTLTRIAHQITIFRTTFLTSKRKRLLRLLLFNVALYQSRRLIRNLRLIFDEVRDVDRKHRSKKKNNRLLARTKTSNRPSNVVVVQDFARFLFLYNKN